MNSLSMVVRARSNERPAMGEGQAAVVHGRYLRCRLPAAVQIGLGRPIEERTALACAIRGGAGLATCLFEVQ